MATRNYRDNKNIILISDSEEEGEEASTTINSTINEGSSVNDYNSDDNQSDEQSHNQSADEQRDEQSADEQSNDEQSASQSADEQQSYCDESIPLEQQDLTQEKKEENDSHYDDSRNSHYDSSDNDTSNDNQEEEEIQHPQHKEQPPIHVRDTPSLVPHAPSHMRDAPSHVRDAPSQPVIQHITNNDTSRPLHAPMLHKHPQHTTSEANKENRGVEEKKKQEKEKEFAVAHQFRTLVKQLVQQRELFERFGRNMPDGGARIQLQISEIEKRMFKLRGRVPSNTELKEMLLQMRDEREEGATASQRKGPDVHMLAGAKMLTSGAVSTLHSALASRPSEDTLTDDPRGLKVPLMTHQKSALTFLLWRETQIPRGGVLADEMGLGKTLSMISLILHAKQERKHTSSQQLEKSDCSYVSEGTLVVAPLTLMSVWENEISSKVSIGKLSVLIYHGPRRTHDPRDLINYDIVITTYNIVSMEGTAYEASQTGQTVKKRSAPVVLFKIHWNRIVLDEAHTIRNPKAAMSNACCNLSANYRWAITGTPVQNELKDFYSLIKFLRLAPFDDLRVWKDVIEGKGLGMKRLQTMVSSLVLRRVKNDLESMKLPNKSIVYHKLSLTEEERSVYNVLFHHSRSFFMKYLHELGLDIDMLEGTGPSLDDLLSKVPSHLYESVQTIMKSMIPQDIEMINKPGTLILVLLLRLRQVCSHFNLLSTALTSSEEDEDIDGLASALASMRIANNDDTPLPEEFTQGHCSSKIKAILHKVKEIISSDSPGSLPNKCIIVSQWTSMLKIIEHHLICENISFTKIDGQVKVRDRQTNINAFNSTSTDPRVMLLSLQAGCVGLTLTAANHLFIVDLHWNPQLEIQASDRCHRVGQTRDVIIHRFLVENTVEAVISLIQEKKLKLAENVLDGSCTKNKKASSKLTLGDLRMLFDV